LSGRLYNRFLAIRSKNKLFPPFRLDTVNLLLWRGDVRLGLAPKAFAVLQFLVENAGVLVTQERLLEAVWPETFVQPEVLRKYILEIRRVLEDQAREPRFVETLSKRGYRFIAEVQEERALEMRVTPPALPPPNLIGRKNALEGLAASLGKVQHGLRQVVFISGEAGIGKTSLADTFCGQAMAGGYVQIARGQCVEGFGGKESYYPVLEALGLFMRGPEGGEMVSTLASHAPTWLIQFPALVTVEQRELLRREILGATHERMLREICEALEVFSAERPLVLTLEDLHLADESTLDLVSALARRRMPAKLLATYRPADVILAHSPLKVLKQDLEVHGLCRELSLTPLSQEEVGLYLRAEFPGSRVAADLSELIHGSSDGNPLFMVALVERLRRHGSILRDGEGWRISLEPGQAGLGVPETLQEMLLVQLDQLSEAERRLLRAASVSGARFPAWSVAAMTGTEETAAEQLCEELAERQQFIRRAGAQELPGGGISAQYEFKHSLYREVLYARLPPAQLRRFHLLLAEKAESLGAARDFALAPEMAAHFEAARDFARAARYQVSSAALAGMRYAHTDSIQMLRRAQELLAHLPVSESGLEIEILERLSDAFYAQGNMAQSADMDYQIVDLAGRTGFPAARIKAWTRLARALAFQDPERCVGVCERAVEAAREYGDPLLEARAEMLRSCWRIVTNGWNANDAAACQAALDRVHGLGVELPAYYEILYAHVQCVGGDYEGAWQTAISGIPKSLENDSLTVFLSAHSSLVFALLHLGRWGELQRVISVGLGTAQKNGNAPWASIFQATLGWLRFHAGDFTGAREIADDLLRSNTGRPAGQVRTMAMVIGSYVNLETGDLSPALERFREICERQSHPRFFLDWYWRIVARLGLSRAFLAAGELAKAGEEVDLALEAALSMADRGLQSLAWETKARIAAVDSNWNRTGECLQQAIGALKSGALPYVEWRVHTTAARWHRANGRNAEADASQRAAATMLNLLADSFERGEPMRETLLKARASSAAY
jgi:DNA-binding winged helix-turn-helix (wHTH) protein